MKSYVTYDDQGALTGGFLQVVPQGLTAYIEVSSDVRMNWPLYKANAARDGVELLPLPDPVVVVPPSVTRRQAKQALLLAGLLGSVQGAIDAIPDATQRSLAQIEWDDSLNFERDRPLLITLATALGLSSEQLDALFITAATL